MIMGYLCSSLRDSDWLFTETVSSCVDCESWGMNNVRLNKADYYSLWSKQSEVSFWDSMHESVHALVDKYMLVLKKGSHINFDPPPSTGREHTFRGERIRSSIELLVTRRSISLTLISDVLAGMIEAMSFFFCYDVMESSTETMSTPRWFDSFLLFYTGFRWFALWFVADSIARLRYWTRMNRIAGTGWNPRCGW